MKLLLEKVLVESMLDRFLRELGSCIVCTRVELADMVVELQRV